MNRQEYTEKMKDLCRRQADLKTSHLNGMEDLEAGSAKRIAEINEETRLKRREMMASYRKEQLEIECAKQQLKTDYVLEHPEAEASVA